MSLRRTEDIKSNTEEMSSLRLIWRDLDNLPVDQILKQYTFSHKFLVSYALECAIYANSSIDEPSAEVLKAIEVVKLWLEDKATAEECRVTAYVAYIAATAYTAAYVATVTYAANAAAYVASTYAARAAFGTAYYKKLLIDKIEKLTDLEKIIMGLCG